MKKILRGMFCFNTVYNAEALPHLRRGLQCNSSHDERNEFSNILMNTLFVQLIHNHNYDRELLENFE